MDLFKNIELVANRKYPKYQQLADALAELIDKGHFGINEKLPTVKQLKGNLKINAETVFNAYNLLREKGIILSDERRGYFVADTNVNKEFRVFLLFDKLTSFKRILYNSFIGNLGENASVDIFFHHHNYSVFKNLILSNLDNYSHFVIVGFVKGDVEQVIQQVPSHKLMLLDTDIPGLDFDYSAVFQNFENDIFSGLHKGLPRLNKYNKIVLINSGQHFHIPERDNGFVRFCVENNFDNEIIKKIAPEDIKPGSLFICQSEEDIVKFIKLIKKKKLTLGEDVGLISFNDSPLLEYVEGGISVLSSDFEKMGKTAAELLKENTKAKIENDFQFIMRGSS